VASASRGLKGSAMRCRWRTFGGVRVGEISAILGGNLLNLKREGKPIYPAAPVRTALIVKKRGLSPHPAERLKELPARRANGRSGKADQGS